MKTVEAMTLSILLSSPLSAGAINDLGRSRAISQLTPSVSVCIRASPPVIDFMVRSINRVPKPVNFVA